MAIDLDAVKQLEEHSLIKSQTERLRNLFREKGEIEVVKLNAETRLTAIDLEVQSIEDRFKSIAANLRTIFNRIDPPGPP